MDNSRIFVTVFRQKTKFIHNAVAIFMADCKAIIFRI